MRVSMKKITISAVTTDLRFILIPDVSVVLPSLQIPVLTLYDPMTVVHLSEGEELGVEGVGLGEEVT